MESKTPFYFTCTSCGKTNNIEDSSGYSCFKKSNGTGTHLFVGCALCGELNTIKFDVGLYSHGKVFAYIVMFHNGLNPAVVYSMENNKRHARRIASSYSGEKKIMKIIRAEHLDDKAPIKGCEYIIFK